MPEPLGFCLVGCGMIARFHAQAIQEIPGARVAALVSRTAESAQKLLADTGLPPLPGVPLRSRRPWPRPASRRSSSPPPAATTANRPSSPRRPASTSSSRSRSKSPARGATAIIDACDQRGVKLCTIFPSRFGDANIALKAAVDAGKFGRLTLGETTCKWWRTQAYYDEGGWKGTQALDGGGAMMNQAIHNVDLLLWMMGDATHVSGFTATLAHERIEVEDTAVAVIRFKSGALGVIQATTSVHPGYPKTIAVHGDRGSAVIEQDDVLRWDFTPATADDAAVKERFAAKVGASGGAADPKAISHEGHRRQLADFVAAIRDDRAPKVDGREGKKAVDLICAIYESARTGRTVAL